MAVIGAAHLRAVEWGDASTHKVHLHSTVKYEVSKRRAIAAIGTLNAAAPVYCFQPHMEISGTAVSHTVS